MTIFSTLVHIALTEFADIVTNHELIRRRASVPLKLRLYVCDGTLIDIWLSSDQARYAYHWEQRAIRGLIHRHDNAPDHPDVLTFPKHFHNRMENVVEPSTISDDPATALREFLQFVRNKLESLD